MSRHVTFLAVCCMLIAAGCSQKQEKPATPQPAPAPVKKVVKPKEGLEAGNPTMIKAVKAVLEKCEVSEFGYARKCKEEADKNLRKEERTVGVKEALMTYCLALSDKNHLVQALAAAQMNLLGYSRAMKENSDAKILDCLMEVLKTARQGKIARPVARTATYIATALNRHEDMLKVVESNELREVKQAGYGALWANGRMQVFDILAKAIQENKDILVRVAAINSFREGGKLTDDEKEKVCGLITPLMLDENLRVGGAAANRVANSCPEMKDKVLEAAESMIKKGKFDTSYVAAVGSVHGFFGAKATKKQKRRILSILNKVLKSSKFSDLTRSSALRKIAWVDKKVGARMAKRMLKSDSTFIRRAAEWILKREKSKG